MMFAGISSARLVVAGARLPAIDLIRSRSVKIPFTRELLVTTTDPMCFSLMSCAASSALRRSSSIATAR